MQKWSLVITLCIFGVAGLGAGCAELFSHSVDVAPDYYPSVFKAEKSAEPIALWIPAALCDTIVVTNPSSGYASAHTFSFILGPALTHSQNWGS